MDLMDPGIDGTESVDDPETPDDATLELIIRRRKQLMVHSFVYYRMNDTIVNDHMFDKMCEELVELQNQYGTQHGFYDEYFHDFRGETGMHFPADAWIINKAEGLIRHRNRLDKEPPMMR